MSTKSQEGPAGRNTAIAFGHRLARSPAFAALYDAGMALVEETTDYLGDEGKQSAQNLSTEAALLYTTESMRLTTRLMQIASWLLLQRAVNDGEMTVEQGMAEKAKIRLSNSESTSSDAIWDELPVRLRELISRSREVQLEIRRLNDVMSGVGTVAPPGASVDEQLSALERAFSQA